MNCPLCKNNEITILESVDRSLLNKQYKKLTGIEDLVSENLDYCECDNCYLRFFNPLVTGDEAFYNSLQGFDWYYMDEKEEYSEARKYIKKTDKVLEVGSGKGAFAKFISAKHYVGLDFSENAKKMAAKEGIDIQNDSIQDYAKKHTESADVVVSFQVLEHVSDPDSFLRAKVEALKVGGKLIVAVPSEDSFLKYVTNGILNMPPHHVTRWSDKTLDFVADRYGLQVIDVHHEKLQDVHKTWFVQTLIYSAFMKLPLLTNSLKHRLLLKICSHLAITLEKGLKNEMLPNGHTVVAVYKK